MGNPKTCSISLKTLRETLGCQTKYGHYIHQIEGHDGGEDYYDLHASCCSNDILCMDGETCEIIGADDENITLRSEVAGGAFRLSHAEFGAAVFEPAGKYALLNVEKTRDSGRVDGNYISGCTGTFVEAVMTAIATEKANSGRITVAVISGDSGYIAPGSFFIDKERLDVFRTKQELA